MERFQKPIQTSGVAECSKVPEPLALAETAHHSEGRQLSAVLGDVDPGGEMVKVQGSTVIARPVDVVFDFVADERNEPRYNPRMVRVEKSTDGPIAQGTRWSATIEARGRPLAMDMEITDFTRPSRLATVTRMSTAEIRGAVTFRPDPSGTRMEWSWDLRPKGALRLLGPLIARTGRRQEAQTWAGLKRYLEESAPRERNA